VIIAQRLACYSKPVGEDLVDGAFFPRRGIGHSGELWVVSRMEMGIFSILDN